MRSFQHSVLPLPFCHSVAAVAIARENGIAGNVFPLTLCRCMTRTLIGCPATAERQKYDSILFATERQLWHNGRWQRQRHNEMVETSNIILTELTEFLRNFSQRQQQNGNSRTATERWKLRINHSASRDNMVDMVQLSTRVRSTQVNHKR